MSGGILNTKILVIDDNPEDGYKVVETLWKIGLHVLFIKYDEADLINFNRRKMTGVRAIFLDIDLRGSGLQSKNDFSPALSVIEHCLDSKNGPWALITWSNYDDWADNLYNYLKERIKNGGNKPISLSRMRKEDFIVDHNNNSQKNIQDEINEILNIHSSLFFLSEWESNLQVAASTVIRDFAIVANSSNKNSFNENMECLLWKLAKAGLGQLAQQRTDISPTLYPILSNLMIDNITNIKPFEILNEPDCKKLESALPDWKYRINALLHLDILNSQAKWPGTLYQIPNNQKETKCFDFSKYLSNKEKCIRTHFLNFPKHCIEYNNRKQISKECDLYLMDITPKCDHVQNKEYLRYFRRFIIVCWVPFEYKKYLWHCTITNEREENKLKSECLKLSPDLMIVDKTDDKKENKKFVLVFNVNLQLSIPETALQQILTKPKGRIREQLLNDIMRWLGHYSSRSGHLSL